MRTLWLALGYALATLLAQVGHDHGSRRSGPDLIEQPGCNDPRPHYADHVAHEIVRGDLDCPACQFRVTHQAGTSRSTSIAVVVRRVAFHADSPRLRPTATSRPSSRGPPLA